MLCVPGPNRESGALWKRIQALKHLLSIQKFGEKDVDNPRNFQNAGPVVRVIRIVSGSQQTRGKLEEAVKKFDFTPLLSIDENEESNSNGRSHD